MGHTNKDSGDSGFIRDKSWTFWGVVVATLTLIVTIVGMWRSVFPPITNTNRNVNSNSNETKPDPPVPKSGRVLVLASNSSSLVATNTVIRRISKELTANSLSITLGSDLDSDGLIKFRKAVARLDAGDLAAGKPIPFAVIVIASLSVTPLDPVEQLHAAVVNGTVRAIKTETGETIVIHEISNVRGFGVTEDQAVTNASNNVCDTLTDSLFRRISGDAH